MSTPAAGKSTPDEARADRRSKCHHPVVAEFSVRYIRYLDEHARIVNELPEFAADNAAMLDIFRTMLLLRRFDHKVLMLHRTGKIGTYPGTMGQEAVGVGMGRCLTDDDVHVPYYRGATDMYVRGVQLHEILAFWMGDERASNYRDPRLKHDLPIPICIASQLPHAAGIASAIKLRKQENRAVLTAVGDGGTSEGDFYETLNVAGAWHLPMVMVINNNRWALTEPNTRQTRCATLAQKAVSGGFEGIQVDGNDVIAVQAAVDEAMKKARAGGGPTLIEALTYRLCAHTTIDNLERYVDPEEHKTANQKEPLVRLRTLLQQRGVLDDRLETRMENEIKEEIEEQVDIALNMPPQPVDAMFDYLHAEPPERLIAQKAQARAWEAGE